MRKNEASGTTAAHDVSAPPLGRRERNKLEKLTRIKNAARDLFLRLGYDKATTAKIAHEADVSMSTIFFYAQDKRDLLFLIFNEWFDGTLAKMEAAPLDRKPAMKALIDLFRPLYEHHTAEPNLARATLRELNFFSEGKQAQKFYRNTSRIMALITGIIEAGQARGEIAAEIDPELAANVVFATYQAEIRRYLAGSANDVEAGLERLRSAFHLLMIGLTAGKRITGNGRARGGSKRSREG